tara:strand:- start:4632 stop:5024 length:393 start_codon:yes stop_codon:yes gene_type:complete
MSGMSTEVCATVKIVGFHCWSGAPEDVDHLTVRHRHLFTVRVWCWVGHPDREVEFHQLQRRVHWSLVSMYGSEQNQFEIELDGRGCEHVANDLIVHPPLNDLPISRVEVWEDDENGAVIYTDEKPYRSEQ